MWANDFYGRALVEDVLVGRLIHFVLFAYLD